MEDHTTTATITIITKRQAAVAPPEKEGGTGTAAATTPPQQQAAAAATPARPPNATSAAAFVNGTSNAKRGAPNATIAAAQQEKQRPKPLGVRAMQPSSVTQFVANRVTVDINGSLCSQLKQNNNKLRSGGSGKQQNATAAGAQLHLRNARHDGQDAVFSGNTTGNCTHLVFPVTPDSDVRSGSFAARVSTPSGVTVQLPSKITVVRPITVSAVVRSVEVPADGGAREIKLRLSGPSKSNVKVRVQLSDSGIQVSLCGLWVLL